MLGNVVCNKAFMRLLSLGKSRFFRLSRAVRDGNQTCPMDGRYCPSGPAPMTEKVSAVYDFLFGLYTSAAECLPDSNHTSSNKRPRWGKYKFDTKDLDRTKLKHLPPGKIMDYFRLCQLEHPNLKITRKLFCFVLPSVNINMIL